MKIKFWGTLLSVALICSALLFVGCDNTSGGANNESDTSQRSSEESTEDIQEDSNGAEVNTDESSGESIDESTEESSDECTDESTDESTEKPDEDVCEHSFSDWVITKQVTCKEDGELVRECGKCFIEERVSVPKTDVHVEVVDGAIEPTCTENGKTEGKHCSACGEILVAQTTVEAVGHTEVIDEAIEPTCTEDGKTEGKHCSVCGEILVAQTTVEALGHVEVIDEAVEPTCTENGKTEGKHCSVCGEILVAQTAVIAEHTYIEDNCIYCGCTHEKYFLFYPYGDGYRIACANADTIPEDVAIPSHYKGLPVLCVSRFNDCVRIASVVIPDTVTTLDERAFSGCNSLKTVETSPNSAIKSLGKYVFQQCVSLEYIRIPDKVTKIPDYAFRGCLALSNVEFSKAGNLKTIGNWAFSQCSNIEHLNIPEGVEGVYLTSFSSPRITFPSTFKRFYQAYDGERIGGPYEYIEVSEANPYFHSYDNCLIETATNKLVMGSKNSIIPEYVTSIGKGAFYSSYIDYLRIPDSVTEIEDYAFSYSSIRTVVFGKGLKTLGNDAFSYCFSLEDINLPHGLVSIGDNAFADCVALNLLIIPETVQYIGSYAFFELDATTLCYTHNAPLEGWGNNYAVLQRDGSASTKTVLFGFVERITVDGLDVIIYKDGSAIYRYVGNETDIVIPSTINGKTVTHILPKAFFDKQSITSVYLPDGILSIGNSAFAYCSQLAEIRFPSTLQAIEDHAFENCYSLGYIENYVLVIPNGVTYIGEYAFYLTSVTRAVIPESVTFIGQIAFVTFGTSSFFCSHAEMPEGWSLQSGMNFEGTDGNGKVYWNFSHFAKENDVSVIVLRDGTEITVTYW